MSCPMWLTLLMHITIISMLFQLVLRYKPQLQIKHNVRVCKSTLNNLLLHSSPTPTPSPTPISLHLLLHHDSLCPPSHLGSLEVCVVGSGERLLLRDALLQCRQDLLQLPLLGVDQLQLPVQLLLLTLHTLHLIIQLSDLASKGKGSPIGRSVI